MQGRFKKNQRQTLAGSVRREDLGSAGSLPAVFGSLANRNIVGKLPMIAGWQPALPRNNHSRSRC